MVNFINSLPALLLCAAFARATTTAEGSAASTASTTSTGSTTSTASTTSKTLTTSMTSGTSTASPYSTGAAVSAAAEGSSGEDSSATFTCAGCFKDSQNRLLIDAFKQSDNMSSDVCAGLCGDYKYFGLEYGTQCLCGNSLAYTKTALDPSKCSYACSGDSSLTCGGYYALDLFESTSSSS